jgi:hypothetical protein
MPATLLLAVPALLTISGGALEQRGLQRTGLVLMWLLSLSALALGAVFLHDTDDYGHTTTDYHGLTPILGMIAVAFGSCLALSAFLLRHPGWRIEDTSTKEEEAA